ncbi:MAG TPA: pyrroloquinoline quinone biosynthesis protein PqqB [Candidatus Methylomirabilis sp.]|nr:pyrroloquinoline quinone biosynthesis protein PqqB [Candidatus Methylomirabilis sp.]
MVFLPSIMRLHILGAAAGGGFPQWNCGCPNCQEVRTGSIRLTPRTQDSLTVSVDGERWFLLNASPEIGRQIESFPPLHPRGARHSPIQAILLTDGELDHCLGLFSLRESHPLVIYSTERVWRGLVESNAIFRTLRRFPEQVTWRQLRLGVAEDLCGRDGTPGGLSVVALPAPGKLPFHLEGLMTPDPEDNVGVWIRDQGSGRQAVYLPAVAHLDQDLRQALAGADCLFFDGTFWSSEELIRLELSSRRAEDMSHLPIGGPAGSLAGLSGVMTRRKIYTHINNTNPILPSDSPERRDAEKAGWEVAEDGLEVCV